jgi:hypothetical protein
MTFAEWQVGQMVWSMLWFTLFFFWIYTVVIVFSDIFRSRDLGGGAKVAWTLFVIFLPFLGVLSYLIARGGKIGQHAAEDAAAQDAAMRAYIRETVNQPAGGGGGDDLATLQSLKAKGVIDDAEFETMKARLGS